MVGEKAATGPGLLQQPCQHTGNNLFAVVPRAVEYVDRMLVCLVFLLTAEWLLHGQLCDCRCYETGSRDDLIKDQYAEAPELAAAFNKGADDLDKQLEERHRQLEAQAAAAKTPEQRTVEAEGLLAAFRLNLTALSAVSLLVGGFLVFASVRASLTRRREELGVLRAVGATRAQVLALVLGEAALLGVLGTMAGVPLGWLAAKANLGAVSATVRTLYLLEGIEGASLSPGLLLLAIATGAGGAIAGALWPALDAARTDPRP